MVSQNILCLNQIQEKFPKIMSTLGPLDFAKTSKDIMPGHTYRDISPKVFDSTYSMYCLSSSKAHSMVGSKI